MDVLRDHAFDPDRSIRVDCAIDKTLVKRLAPTIRAMRRKSDKPITVLIDSGGGSVADLEKLFQLLRAPDKVGQVGRVVTVVTNDALSAAADLLAWGDYSIALSQARILCHDTRLFDVEELTPELARWHAKGLEDANNYYARVLTERIVHRLIRVYGDLKPRFGECSRAFRSQHRSVKKTVINYMNAEDEYGVFDLAGFAITLRAHLTPQNDHLVERVVARLQHWMHVMPMVDSTPTFGSSGPYSCGMLDGAQLLHMGLGGDPKAFQHAAGDLKLLLGLLVSELAFSSGEEADLSEVLDRGTREFLFMRLMNDRSHVDRAFQLMVEHSETLLGSKFRKRFGRMSDEEKATAFGQQVLPYVRLFWLFCVQLCRELSDGDHELTPEDALLLGLVDEVWEGP